jgi:transposase
LEASPSDARIAPPELRDLRDLLRHRATLVHLRTSIKNRVHALLARQGILPEHSDLFGTTGREYLAALQLPDGPRRRLDSLIALISDFDREIAETTSEIAQRAKGDERVKLLCQVRGIGGDLITGELRLDLRRWRYGASHGKGLQLSGRT